MPITRKTTAWGGKKKRERERDITEMTQMLELFDQK